uniref:Uncharacterized protein n=1 Tax=Romanomermis culicivorax TaxID=13658 RepID=A0A915JNM0_ROMCU
MVKISNNLPNKPVSMSLPQERISGDHLKNGEKKHDLDVSLFEKAIKALKNIPGMPIDRAMDRST